MKELNCIVLDFLPSGYADRRHREPIAQAIGTSFFSLLELVPRENTSLAQEEDVYIGEGKRDKIRFIKGQLNYNELTTMSKNILPDIVERLVKQNEQRFVEFFNKGTIVTPRMHQFQLLPGVGKKHMQDILEERSRKQFTSFADISERVKLFPDPIKTIVRRIMQELEGNEKYYLFAVRQMRRF